MVRSRRIGRRASPWTFTKVNGDALNIGNYRGLKLTEHVMKVMERIMDEIIRDSYMIHELILIDKMQFAFVPGWGTNCAIFIICQLQEKFLSMRDLDDKNLTLYFAFVDLEKAFDKVPFKVIWWALCSLGVYEWIVHLLQAMYSKTRSKVRAYKRLVQRWFWHMWLTVTHRRIFIFIYSYSHAKAYPLNSLDQRNWTTSA